MLAEVRVKNDLMLNFIGFYIISIKSERAQKLSKFLKLCALRKVILDYDCQGLHNSIIAISIKLVDRQNLWHNLSTYLHGS